MSHSNYELVVGDYHVWGFSEHAPVRHLEINGRPACGQSGDHPRHPPVNELVNLAACEKCVKAEDSLWDRYASLYHEIHEARKNRLTATDAGAKVSA